MTIVTRSLTISPETPAEVRRADRAVQSLASTSRRRTQALFDNDCVTLNDQKCHEPWRPLADGDRVEVSFDPQQQYEAVKRPPRYLGFDILFEDDHLIVVDKPAAWLTIPSDKHEKNTLVHRISDYLTKKNRGRRRLIYPAHRLDRGVSGVLVLGKTTEIAAALRKQFEQHKPQRHYLAIVAGKVEPTSGTIQTFLATDATRKRFSTDDEEAGELAITHYQVEKPLADTTLVRIWLETGRRNQIRVHFAERGNPILGDARYGERRARHEGWPESRLALHAARLTFDHPIGGVPHEYVAPLAVEFETFVAKH